MTNLQIMLLMYGTLFIINAYIAHLRFRKHQQKLIELVDDISLRSRSTVLKIVEQAGLVSMALAKRILFIRLISIPLIVIVIIDYSFF